MGMKILSAATIILAFTAYGAQAEQFTQGTVKAYDQNAETITLDNGSTFALRPGGHPAVTKGEAVVVASDDNYYGTHYADVVAPATSSPAGMNGNQ
ncbi:hypothetical protein GCM10011491_24670 [Brucella endophytica]|uniref:Uncharacterized protein n=1 Tax=Brucella endophytica TaxID=1963359 RepID=A0A916SFY9_9HYPH|nr:hypothetical protein [Brucella endophytica]GGA95413.1 hypothetical protein GCM10011491_24670 [Brucella endophytica]